MACAASSDSKGNFPTDSIDKSVQYDVYFDTGLVYYVFAFTDLKIIPSTVDQFKMLNASLVDVAFNQGKMQEFRNHDMLGIVLIAKYNENKKELFKSAITDVNSGELWMRNHYNDNFQMDVIAQCWACGNLAEANFDHRRRIRGLYPINSVDVLRCDYCAKDPTL